MGLLLTLLLAGCVSVGQNFDETKVAEIKKGETTEADLHRMFGRPANRAVSSEGKTILTWVYSEASVKGESFIPYAGAFVGGTRSAQKNLTVDLGADGKVQSFQASAGGLESRNMTQGVPNGK